MRIWFNHWFSTVYHLINLIKAGNPGKFTVVGSSQNADAVYKSACDEWHVEPEGLNGKDYAAYCLNFCRENNIDIFAPRKNLINIAEMGDDFYAIGTLLLANTDAELLRIMDNKFNAYEYLSNIIPNNVPGAYLARNKTQFEEIYGVLAKNGGRVCYKLVQDEGAQSFRVIDNSIKSKRGLMNKPGFKVTLDTALNIMTCYDFSIPMILMPFLTGREISADCLITERGHIILPRYKTNKRYSELVFDGEIISLCQKLLDKLNMDMPLNIQFKYEGATPYILEINPRMSGGLQLSCLASGVNIPSIAINKLLGIHKDWHIDTSIRRKVANIETPVCI